MSSKFAFVVSACSKYTVETVALLNSLDFVGNKNDVHIYGVNLPEVLLSQLGDLGYAAIHHPVEEKEVEESHGISEITCRKRYWYAAEVGRMYDSVCVLDADMIFVRDPQLYFEIAAKTGLVLGVSKEQNQAYNDPHHQARGEWIMPEGTCPESDLCNAPLFVDTKIWGDALRNSYLVFINGWPEDNFKGPDMASMNLFLLKYGSGNRTIAMPNVQWLGTNEQMLKPYMRAVEDRGKIKTETGIPIFCFHGHIGHAKWRQCQLDNRNHCAQGYLKASGESLLASNNIAAGSMNLLYERFKKMLFYTIQLPAFNYRHPELDVSADYGDLWNR